VPGVWARFDAICHGVFVGETCRHGSLPWLHFSSLGRRLAATARGGQRHIWCLARCRVATARCHDASVRETLADATTRVRAGAPHRLALARGCRTSSSLELPRRVVEACVRSLVLALAACAKWGRDAKRRAHEASRSSRRRVGRGVRRELTKIARNSALKARQILRHASPSRCCQQSRQTRPEQTIRPDPAWLFQQRIDESRVVVSNSRWSPTESLSDV
jgi:hypothetical protein